MAERKSLLIIDDDPAIPRLICGALRNEPIDCVTASSGEEGIARLIERQFDGVVVDLVMPHGSGADVLDFLSNFIERPSCIVLSALADLWASRNAPARGDVVLSKPVDLGMLVMAIRRLLWTHESH